MGVVLNPAPDNRFAFPDWQFEASPYRSHQYRETLEGSRLGSLTE